MSHKVYDRFGIIVRLDPHKNMGGNSRVKKKREETAASSNLDGSKQNFALFKAILSNTRDTNSKSPSLTVSFLSIEEVNQCASFLYPILQIMCC